MSGSVFHAPLIRENAGLKLTHILSRQKDKISNLYPEVAVVAELSDLLQINNIDLIINTLPNTLHYSVTKQCLAAGKHVVVEKPFVIDSTQGQELIDLAQQRNLILSIYHNRRWDNGYLTLQQNLARLGQLYLYEAYFDRYRPQVNLAKWRETDGPGNGILFDLGAHLIDQALNLFGQPTAVAADLGRQRPNAQTIDYFHITLWYNEMRVILGSSSIMAAPRPVLAAYGDMGSYVKHGLDPQEDMLRLGITPASPNYGIEDPEFSGCLSLLEKNEIIRQPVKSQAGNYPEFYLRLSQALQDRAQAEPVTAKAGLEVIKIIEAAIESNATGHQAVQHPAYT